MSNEKPIKIIQTSYPRTGSTVLVNIIYGLICPDQPIICSDKYIKDVSIQKSHNVDFDWWIKTFSGQFDLYFVVSERNTKHPQRYHKYKNILFINYDDLLETNNNPLPKIVDNVYNKLRGLLPNKIFPNLDDDLIKQNAIKRIENMNKLYESIKEKPFTYYDLFYHIHGHHRNR